jgi:hypothetical protein
MKEEKSGKAGDAAARLAELRSGRRGEASEPAPQPESPESENEAEQVYSTRSVDRHQKSMLELRFKTDDAEAFPYSYLTRAKFNPSKGILLDFAVAEVQISGQNLRQLYTDIVAQRQAFVQEVDELYAEATTAPGATVVTQIEVVEQNEEKAGQATP